MNNDSPATKGDIEVIHNQVKGLSSTVATLKTQISDGHFCKWNSKIGSILEWKDESNPTQKHIFKVLDEHTDKLNEHDLKINELQTSNKLMTEIKNNQEQQALDTKHNRFYILIVLLTCLFNVFGPSMVLAIQHLIP